MGTQFAYNDVLDTRDLAERYESLTALLDENDIDEDEENELVALEQLNDQFSDGLVGAENIDPTLIHEDYFTEYAKQLAYDCGMVNETSTWPNNHIDWDSAADELQSDYSSVEYAGETYYVREV